MVGCARNLRIATTLVLAVTVPDVCGMFCVVLRNLTLQSAFVQGNTEYDTLPPSYILLVVSVKGLMLSGNFRDTLQLSSNSSCLTFQVVNVCELYIGHSRPRLQLCLRHAAKGKYMDIIITLG